MKKSLARKITLSILAGAVLMSSSVVWAGVTVDVAPPGSGWIGIDVDSNTSIDIYAPQNSYNSTASYSHNEVTLSTGANYSFAGGYSETGYDPRGNNIKISSGGTFNGFIYGGYATQGGAFSNTVVIEGGIFNGNIYGGYSKQGKAGDLDDGNSVTINAGDFAGGKSIYGGYAEQGAAKGNTVSIKNSNFGNGCNLYGGKSLGGEASYNEIEIIGGAIGNGANSGVFVYGGRVENPNTAQSAVGDASNNKVTLNVANAYYNGVYGGYSDNGNANDNVLTITGGNFSGTIYGGNAANGSATGNTINIAGSADLSSAWLRGGYGSDRSSDLLTNNVLNIGDDNAGWKGTVSQVSNFEKINFNNLEWEADKAALTVSSELGLGKTNQKTTVMVNSLSKEGAKPKEGETMTLIDYNNLSGSGGLANDEQEIKIGSFVKAEGLIKQDTTDKKITLTITKVSSNEQALVIGESRAAATVFTNQGSEIIETGLDALARDNDKDTKVFAALYGNASEFATGSHVKVNGWSGMVGVGKTNADGLTVGAFFENGEGNYRTYNTVDGDFMRGDGEACYNGGGFLVRKDNANGVYTEASLRAGNLQNELRNAVLAGDKLAGYDIDTFYYGVHVGIGKVIPRGNDGDSIDVYGKFIYTHHDSENFKIDGDEFHFDSVDSERLRLGFRINEVQTNKLAMYYGAAWEYEFGGDADNKVVGYDLSTPSLGGSTVIGEIGAHYKASEKWSFDLNARAYGGQRDGFSGSVQANYSF